MRSAGNFHPEWGYLAPAPSFMRTVRTALVATAIGAVAGAVVVVSLVERPGSNDDSAIATHALLTRAPAITAPAAPSRAGAPAVAKAAPVPAPTQPSVATAAHPAVTASTRAVPPVPTQPPVATAIHPAATASAPALPPVATNLAGADKADKPDKAESISPPLPLAAPRDAAIASTGPVAGGSSAEADAATAPETAADSPAPAKRSVVRHRRYEPYRRQEAAGTRNRWRDNRGFGPLFRLFSFSGSPYSSN
jgi:hypothetical protein